MWASKVYLENIISEERKKNKTLERNIREQLCDEFNEMLVEVNKSNSLGTQCCPSYSLLLTPFTRTWS